MSSNVNANDKSNPVNPAGKARKPGAETPNPAQAAAAASSHAPAPTAGPKAGAPVAQSKQMEPSGDAANAVAHADSTVSTGDSGKTSIEDGVVAKVAGIATREVDGVYALGGGAARALGALRGAIGQTDLTQGISVEVGEKQVAVDVSMIVQYPHPIQQVADSVRRNVYQAVEKLVGLQVVEVNIAVTDIHINSEDSAKEDSQNASADRPAPQNGTAQQNQPVQQEPRVQ